MGLFKKYKDLSQEEKDHRNRILAASAVASGGLTAATGATYVIGKVWKKKEEAHNKAHPEKLIPVEKQIDMAKVKKLAKRSAWLFGSAAVAAAGLRAYNKYRDSKEEETKGE